jgi:alpha-L-fucosidase 2
MKGNPSLTVHEQKDDANDGPIDTPENRHRHNSHLLGVYPLRQISYEQTPDLAAAAKVSAVARGDSKCWMSYPHLSLIFSRLYEGNLAYEQVRRYFKATSPNLFGTIEFDSTPALPGMFAEMLLQSQQKDIHLLPALPDAWPSGTVRGLRARGGYEVDETWRDKKLTSVTIRSIAGRAVNVRYGNDTVSVPLQPGGTVVLDGNLKPVAR